MIFLLEYNFTKKFKMEGFNHLNKDIKRKHHLSVVVTQSFIAIISKSWKAKQFLPFISTAESYLKES